MLAERHDMKTTIKSSSPVVLAVLTLLALGGCAASGHPTAISTVTHTVVEVRTKVVTTPAPTVTVTPQPTATVSSSPPASSGASQIIARFSGTGTQNTPTFSTPSSWHLSWSYRACPGGTSNFQVTEYNSDGSIDLNGISVNELGTGRGPVATYAYGDAGTHYLSVNTEGCSWSLVPVTG
jgi:hypothetical protein